MNKKNFFDDLETGKISEKEFIDSVKLKTNNASDDQIKYAWNKMLLNLPLDRLLSIKRMMCKYQTFSFKQYK